MSGRTASYEADLADQADQAVPERREDESQVTGYGLNWPDIRDLSSPDVWSKRHGWTRAGDRVAVQVQACWLQLAGPDRAPGGRCPLRCSAHWQPRAGRGPNRRWSPLRSTPAAPTGKLETGSVSSPDPGVRGRRRTLQERPACPPSMCTGSYYIAVVRTALHGWSLKRLRSDPAKGSGGCCRHCVVPQRGAR